MAEVEVPIAFCPACDSDMPVFIGDVDIPGMTEKFRAVICPICESLLNKSGDIEVSYYLVDDLDEISQFRGEVL